LQISTVLILNLPKYCQRFAFLANQSAGNSKLSTKWDCKNHLFSSLLVKIKGIPKPVLIFNTIT
jgi:hypothetical protein